MTQSLPPKPSLRFLKEQAKDLLKAKSAGDTSSCRVLRNLRRFACAPDTDILAADVPLKEVQFALAMHYGFGSWEHLTRAVAVRDHVVERIKYWDRWGPAEGFDSSTEGKTQGILADPDWMRLAEMEMSLGKLSEAGAKIRRHIASLERCHESYVGNVEAILSMIGTMTPGQVIDCGQASDGRRAEAAAYARALEAWAGDGSAVPEDDRHLRQVLEVLGEKTAKKVGLVRHLIGKLRDNRYKVDGGSEDHATIKARLEHLDICNFNWRQNLMIVVRAIAAGKQLVPGHTPEGFKAHGDCPDRTETLYPVVEEVVGWISGRPGNSGHWAQLLGGATPEKRWLAASLCKTIVAHHARVGTKKPPSLLLS